MSFDYKSWDEILRYYISPNIISDIDHYMGIQTCFDVYHGVRWFNFKGKFHRKMNPAEIILSPDKQKIWCKHGETCRSDNAPCHMWYYDTGELQCERWDSHKINYMPCAIWYHQSGEISYNLLCLSNKHVHEKIGRQS